MIVLRGARRLLPITLNQNKISAIYNTRFYSDEVAASSSAAGQAGQPTIFDKIISKEVVLFI